jgi:hypothetical protein
MSFDPGLNAARAPFTRAPYATGGSGIRQSIEAMCQKMREGKVDDRVIGWTGRVLKDAGLDGRSRATTVVAQCTALLDAYRVGVVYAPDPYGTELVQGAAATLCLAPGLCLNRGDCDDGTVAVGSATLSLGIPTMIVKQNFGADAQEHVLVAVYDGSDWRYMDPSTNLPFGSALSANDEVWVDPMEPIGNLPGAQPEIVTLGRPGVGLRSKPNRAPPTPMPHWPGLGAIVAPGDVLAYRSIWDSYVMDTARAAATCAAAWTATAAGGNPATPPNTGKFATPPDAKTLALWAKSNQDISDSIVASWNRHAGLADWEIVVMAGDILQDFQKTVQDVGQFYQLQIHGDCPGLTMPTPPGLELQKNVIARVEGLGILAHGTLQLFTMGAGGALETYKTLGQKLTNPTTIEIGGIGIFLGVVGTVAGLYALNRLIPSR